MYLPPGGLVTFPLIPAGFCKSGLEALAFLLEVHFRDMVTNNHAQKLRTRKAPTASFVGMLNCIVPCRDSSVDMIISWQDTWYKVAIKEKMTKPGYSY
jgi:hypothetical protein